MPQDKINAYLTLHNTLVTLSKLAAPFIPFMAEQIYMNLVVTVDKKAPVSVHLCNFPVADEKMIDIELEKNMELVLDVVVLGRACRNNAQIKNRQPIGLMYISAEKKLPDLYLDIVSNELNIKTVNQVSDASEFTTYNFKPQLKTVGPKYGKLLGRIRTEIESLDGNVAMSTLNTGKALEFSFDGEKVTLDSYNFV